MRNTLETTETSGLVLMISKPGRMVCAVVCAAPETMPSASPRCTIIVPKYATSVTVSRACSIVTPLCARSFAYSTANLSRSSGSNGLRMSAAAMSRPSSAARWRISLSSPRIVSLATCLRNRVLAALRMRSSVPSGSTMWRWFDLARSNRSYSNMSGVTTSDLLTSSLSSSTAPSTCCSNRARAVSNLRGESAARRPRVLVTTRAVS